MFFTVALGMAKPMPGAAPPWPGSCAASVGTPTTWLSRFTSAPPLLPGLIAALVWMAAVISAWPPGSEAPMVRPVAETMPWVTLSVRPSGLPMASTISPI